MQLFLISGLSGSGKSVALKTLEDAGFYCVDNLPVELLLALVENLRQAGYVRVAVSIDMRGGIGVQQLPQHIEIIRRQGLDVRLLFLEAQTETLVKRFSETRRLHPLNDGARTLPECVSLERELLSGISEIGHRIDTSELSPNALRAWVKEFIRLDRARLTLLFQSFGFKHGIPLDADFVFDVRCLPNPHYDPALRPLTGRDQVVIDFLDAVPAVKQMFVDIRDFIQRWLPSFVADNRSYLTIAVGCTGGQHRSVYFAERLAQHFQAQHQVLVRHRELKEERT